MEGTPTKRSYLWHPAVIFAATFVTGSAFSFVVVAELAGSVGLYTDELVPLAAVALLGGFLVGHEIRGLSRPGFVALGLRRQTPRGLRAFADDRVIAAAWGFDAGLGFTTYRVTNGWWLLAGMVAGDVVAPIPVALAYGSAFSIGLWWNLSRWGAVVRSHPPRLLVHLPAVRRITTAVEAASVVAIVVALTVTAVDY